MIVFIIFAILGAVLAVLIGLALRKGNMTAIPDPDWDTDDAIECGEDVDAW